AAAGWVKRPTSSRRWEEVEDAALKKAGISRDQASRSERFRGTKGSSAIGQPPDADRSPLSPPQAAQKRTFPNRRFVPIPDSNQHGAEAGKSCPKCGPRPRLSSSAYWP